MKTSQKELRFDTVKELLLSKGFKRSSSLINAATYNLMHYKVHAVFHSIEEQYMISLYIEVVKNNKPTDEKLIFSTTKIDTIERLLNSFIKEHALIYFEEFYDKMYL
jgi:hypothetical protein